MQIQKIIRNDILYKKERLVRVIVQFHNGTTSAGTGFFINNTGELLTCFHVISGNELCNLKEKELLNTDMQNFLLRSIMKIEIEMENGKRETAKLVKFNDEYDVALLKIDSINNQLINAHEIKTPFFAIDTDYITEYDESTFFCGFQLSGGYTDPTQYPFSTNRAVVSAFPDIMVAGKKYGHIQLNSINLGGNSGAPLFAEGSNIVIGVINGNMNWKKGEAKDNIPLCIAYATSMELIKATGII